MKNVKFLLSAALVFLASAALAQDFSGPQYAKWGATPEEREQNILNSNFLKESCDNRDYDAAAHYLKGLIDKIPDAAESIYQRGAVVYKNKINRAKSVAEKNMFIDSLMLMYDMRAQYFGDNVKPGKTAFILDQKAREFLRYKPNDRKGIREAFRAAIAQGGDSTDPETVVAYFSNLCEDYKNTDEVLPDEIIAEYDRLTPFFEKNPEAGDYKSQFDAAFGLSGAASCENLENLFRGKLEAAPDDEALLAQAVALMSRAKCDGDFYFSIAEKYYTVKPSSETAMFLAQAFQSKGDYTKAMKYLNEALAVVALKKDRLDDKTVAAFRGAVADAARLIESEPDRFRAVMVKKGLLPAPVAQNYTMVRFSMFGTNDGLPPLPSAEDVRRVGEWMVGKNMIKAVPAYDSVVIRP